MTLNAVSVDIVTLLDDNSFGTAGTDLFGMEWGQVNGQDVDNQILVIDTSGVPSDLKDLYEQPAFQILVRGDRKKSTKDVHDQIRAIHEFLMAQGTIIINTTSYREFEYNSLPNAVGRDENDRYVYSANYWTYRNPT